MSDIVEFLEARIAEDEALAQAAIAQHRPDEWESELGSLNLWPEDIAFWANQTPPKVLADCAAKREIIPHLQDFTALEALAYVYKDHPDYDKNWRR